MTGSFDSAVPASGRCPDPGATWEGGAQGEVFPFLTGPSP